MKSTMIIKVKYQLISSLMLLSFAVHILFSCFYMEQKVICKSDENVSIENINTSGNCGHNSKIVNADRNYFTNTQCEDYQFVKHTDDYRITNQKNINEYYYIQYISKQIDTGNDNNADFEKKFYFRNHEPYSIKVKTTSSLLI